MNRLFWILMLVIGVGAVLLMFNDSAGNTLGVENDDFGRLIWLGAFGALIGAGLLRSGRPLGAMARNLGAWAAIALALIAGYQYRYELQDFANRVTAGLVPGSPLALGIEDGHATVTLDKADNGHFEARILINGAPVRTVVDTGATSTVLTSQDAQAAGINPAALDFTIPVSTANGTARAAAVKTNELAIGGIVRKNMPVMVAAPGMLGQSLLGMNFISSLSGFDVRGDRMTLRD
ncbi:MULTISPECIES: TIGR02281 family clan AA aspartic protease [unclassified Mesorhizobium]|uniref:TIGR02281 family clan AA aspartic protease n=1 Tax=unclassified Mesorhizobium TaxID=325217 RepID=UPI00112A3BB1|nr:MULTISPECIES: TIGR02281 family clan AA aspartic protease [unclassified Mesorhizobium]TPJ46360.1 TIGR02281 family clan AA aspartic protease [Mesorhizobium sp. B2-6-6]MCA0003508.1 TIGR02281 family clan AA aspartic protease [Mesorhizobium sp. B264B2A]MCA0009853.1 TIGR02281 family clan AA aspartic protease [Mesorhizobium sp. B264B1B]MCA0020154.1 TIGR02281 family clan AA aspartic protease [Mesorhizobium sp. B264B1A]MCA0027428.1 TIGR02281 family clan AA aspartic protease [Mesorhizobium sp. B263B1